MNAPARLALGSIALIALAACSGGDSTADAPALPSVPSAVHRAPVAIARNASAIVAPNGYTVSVFATGADGNTKPDAIFAQGRNVYVAFQNRTTATGGDGDSTIVQYDRSGKALRSTRVPGRCDGMRFNPYTNLIWLTVNEDANSALYTWNPATNTLQHYTFSAATHMGGYDDLAFTGGKAFIAASNPTLTSAGTNPAPAIVQVELVRAVARVSPVLFGNQTAADIRTGATVTLNLTDPDSLTVDPAGDLILVAQADQELVAVHQPGEPGQRVARLQVSTQLDDTVWSTDRAGTLYVADSSTNVIYTVRGPLDPGTIYTETPSDSSLPGIVGTVDPKTGTVTPLITGFTSPSGLIFVSDKT